MTVVLLRGVPSRSSTRDVYTTAYSHLVLRCRGKSNNFTLGELRNRSLSFSLPVAYRTHYARPVANKERHGRRKMPWEIGEVTFRDYRSLSNYPSELIRIINFSIGMEYLHFSLPFIVNWFWLSLLFLRSVLTLSCICVSITITLFTQCNYNIVVIVFKSNFKTYEILKREIFVQWFNNS